MVDFNVSVCYDFVLIKSVIFLNLVNNLRSFFGGGEVIAPTLNSETASGKIEMAVKDISLNFNENQISSLKTKEFSTRTKNTKKAVSVFNEMIRGSFFRSGSPNKLFLKKELVTDQAALIPILIELGYKTNPTGLCFGVMSMGTQAIVLGDIRTYDRRLKKIDCLISTGKLLKKDRADLLPFFDGIELYSLSYMYPHLFDDELRPYVQNDRNLLACLSSLVVPDKLKEKGGLSQIACFSGIYTKLELEKYFQSLQKSCGECLSPFALQLLSGRHAITVGYDPKKGNWIVINAARMSSLKYENLDEVAQIVLSAFCDEVVDADLIDDPMFTISTRVIVSKDEESAFQVQLDSWKNSSEFQSIHQVTGLKSYAKDLRGYPWIVHAARIGDLEGVKKLVEYGVEIDGVGPDGCTALLLAVEHGYLEIVLLLLEVGADFNKIPSGMDCSPIELAFQNNHKEIALALQKAEEDFKLEVQEGSESSL